MPLNQLLDGQHPQNILIYHYLRGIDGMLPGTSVAEGAKTEEKKSKRKRKKQSSLAREMTEGLNQADYLRRLARELVDRNEEFRRKGKSEIKAVGVLGSDVYDKLLVMEALRDALPNAIFFTNQLDARLAHPDEWRWTRNLLVGSPFGLTLREEYQDVPPFRESDQTAFYTATLLAAGNPARAEFLKKQRCVASRASLRNRPQGGVRFDSSLHESKDAPAGKFRHGAMVEPGARNLNSGHWLLRDGRNRLVSLRNSGTPQASKGGEPGDRSFARVLGSSWNMFVILGLCSVVLVWGISCYNASEGEPYSWNDGISIWPTETLRLFAVSLSVFYIWKINKALWESERRVECNFALPKYQSIPSRNWPRARRIRRLREKSWWRPLDRSSDSSVIGNATKIIRSMRRNCGSVTATVEHSERAG